MKDTGLLSLLSTITLLLVCGVCYGQGDYHYQESAGSYAERASTYQPSSSPPPPPPTATTNITVAEYLCRRLVDVGAPPIFMVPVDYAATLSKTINNISSLHAITVSTEQDAGYAAWGYARESHEGTPGVIAVGSGVGGPGIVNAMEGAFRDEVPILIIVSAADNQRWAQVDAFGPSFYTHHILEGRQEGTKNLFLSTTVRQAYIQNPLTAATSIDDAIIAALVFKRPSYIEVRADVWSGLIPAPASKIDKEVYSHGTVEPIQENIEKAVNYTLNLMKNATRPLIKAGREIATYGATDVFEELINYIQVPFMTNLASKAIVSEDSDYFVGYSDSVIGLPADYYYHTDFFLEIGSIETEGNWDTVGDNVTYTYIIRQTRDYVVNNRRDCWGNVPVDLFLKELLKAAKSANYRFHGQSLYKKKQFSCGLAVDGSARISYTSFSQTLCKSNLITSNTTLLGDVSLSLDEVENIKTPKWGFHTDLWGTIGWTVSGSVGIRYASPHKRVISVVGDGGFQNSPSGISTASKLKYNNIYFILNNNVYAQEQARDSITPFTNLGASFIPEMLLVVWDYAKLVEAQGAVTRDVYTNSDLQEAMEWAKIITHKPVVIVVHLPMRSYPDEDSVV